VPATPSEVIGQLRWCFSFLQQYGDLSPRTTRRVHDQPFERAFARTLIGGIRPQLAGYQFSIVPLRSLTGQSSAFVVAIARRLTFRRSLTVFVGHPFIDEVSSNLRHNLQLILRPYRIRPVYADTDMPNGPLFETILERIRASDFCIFDDRETEVRPNVFIELGAAITLDRPYFYLNFQEKRTLRIGRKREKITAPSDLAGMLHIQYSAYDGLIRDLAMRLPGFLLDRRLARLRTV
jgi:hypothetical protein